MSTIAVAASLFLVQDYSPHAVTQLVPICPQTRPIAVPAIPHAQVYFLHAVTELALILLRAPLTVETVFLRLALV